MSQPGLSFQILTHSPCSQTTFQFLGCLAVLLRFITCIQVVQLFLGSLHAGGGDLALYLVVAGNVFIGEQPSLKWMPQQSQLKSGACIKKKKKKCQCLHHTNPLAFSFASYSLTKYLLLEEKKKVVTIIFIRLKEEEKKWT